MNKRTVLIAGAVVAVVAFATGYVVSPGGSAAGGGAGGEREILYYVDPMNPSFRSPEPGTAPCGMALEPVDVSQWPHLGKPGSLGIIFRDQFISGDFGRTYETRYDNMFAGSLSVDEFDRLTTTTIP